MNPMYIKIQTLYPEIILTATAFFVMIVGLSPSAAVRRATYHLCMLSLIVAGIISAVSANPVGSVVIAGNLAVYIKVAVCIIGLVLLMTAAELPDEAGDDPDPRKTYDAGNTSRGEVYGFLLLSLVGVMLCAGADDLVWLFLALELTSLPTYVLVATSRSSIKAPEAGVKYFFLGAFAAAIFLYGFALIYTATGTTYLSQIHEVFTTQGVSALATVGVVLAIVGLCFKIAAFPMHGYAADVYQGAATPITTFLAFVPKTAGFVSLILLLGAVGWPLEAQQYIVHSKVAGVADQTLHTGAVIGCVLWIIAVVTMFLGNTLALIQSNVKRVLAYSSIAHTGYMLVGLVAGPVAAPGNAGGGMFIRNGIAALLFYIVAYGAMNLGAFAVLGMLRKKGEEAETFDDLRGLAKREPVLAAIMAICVLSLTGIPFLVGFWGKLFIFGSAISAGYYWLAILGVLNSAIGAYYYLRIIGVCYLHEPMPGTEAARLPSRKFAAGLSAVAVIVLSISAGALVSAAGDAAAEFRPHPPQHPTAEVPVTPAPAPAPVAAVPAAAH